MLLAMVVRMKIAMAIEVKIALMKVVVLSTKLALLPVQFNTTVGSVIIVLLLMTSDLTLAIFDASNVHIVPQVAVDLQPLIFTNVTFLASNEYVLF